MSSRTLKGLKAFAVILFVTGWVGLLFGITIAQETPSGSVSGLVVHRDQEVYRGRVEGASVVISGGDIQKRARTDANGRYTIPDVPTGSYTIQVTAPGLNQTGYPEVRVSEGKRSTAAPAVMATRPPELFPSIASSVYIPGEKIPVNIRGYNRQDASVSISVYRMNLRPFILARNLERYNEKPEKYIEGASLRELVLHPKRDSQGYFGTQTRLDGLEEGAYIVRARMGGIRQYLWFTVSNLALVTKTAKSRTLAYCLDFRTQKPAPGIRVGLYTRGAERASAVTDGQGLAVLPPGSENTLLLAESGKSLAFTISYASADSSAYTALIYTDRPVYRPGHKVYFKGILRAKESNFYSTPPAMRVPITIKDPSGVDAGSLNLETDSFGTFSGSFTVPTDGRLGAYTIEARVQKETMSTGFQVAEYKKPEFKAGITFKRKYFIAGSSIRATVDASYYFGAPVAGGKVSYTVYRTPEYASSEDLGIYSDMEAGYSGTRTGYGELVTEGTAATDSGGRADISIPTEKSGADSTYQVEVNVTDQSLRTVGASGTVPVYRGLFSLSMQTEGYLFRPGSPAEITITAKDHNGRPQSGLALSVTALKQEWEGDTARFKKITGGSATTDSSGNAAYAFTPEQEGYYRVRASGRDRLGNLVESDIYIWVAEDGFSTPGYKGPDIEIIRDKKVYKVGDTARILINSSVKGAWALLTVEGQDLFMHRVVFLKENSTVINLPALAEYVPNAFISVSLMHGKNLASAEVPLNVSPEYKFLKVSVTSDKKVYRPGESARYTVRTLDDAGRPVSAEVSLGVVDESIYAIAADSTPDVRDFFYGPRYNSVQTANSFPDYYLGGVDKDQLAGEVRKYFPDTALWLPNLVTGKDGTATAVMRVPDSLTTWRATARAVTRDTSVGWTRQTVQVTKDLIVRLETPRFLVDGDRCSIGAVLHNYTGVRQRMNLRLKVSGINLQGSLARNVTVNPGAAMRIDWPVLASKPGEATVTAYAAGEKDSDAMQSRFPVLAHGMERISVKNGSAGRAASVKLNLPQSAVPGTVSMQVHVTPTAAGAMLGSLSYLAGYPYGCVEQTMSRFLPSVIAADTLKSLGRRDAALSARLPGMVRAGLSSLYNFQNPDGGWGWWNDESSPYTTAYVVYGLTYARRAGYMMDESVLRRGLESLRNQLARIEKAARVKSPDKAPFSNMNERIYMHYALSLNSAASPAAVRNIYANRKRMDAWGRAVLALTLYEMGDNARAGRVSDELMSGSEYFEGMRHWNAEADTWDWSDSSVEATAYALRALIRRNPDDPRLEEIVRWLAMKRSGGRWDSTKETAAAVYALAEYVKARPELERASYTARIQINGKRAGTVTVTPGSRFARESVININPSALSAGTNTVTITKTGSGPLFYSVVLRYFNSEQNIGAKSSGISITREYFRMAPARDANGEMTLKPRRIYGTARIAGEIMCRLTVRANDTYHYVVIEDPRPAGFEPVEQLSGESGVLAESGGWSPWTHTEVRDEKTAIFATRLPRTRGRNVWVAEYRMRAETPGTFNALPAGAYGMYAPQINGNSRERRVRVR